MKQLEKQSFGGGINLACVEKDSDALLSHRIFTREIIMLMPFARAVPMAALFHR